METYVYGIVTVVIGGISVAIYRFFFPPPPSKEEQEIVVQEQVKKEIDSHMTSVRQVIIQDSSKKEEVLVKKEEVLDQSLTENKKKLDGLEVPSVTEKPKNWKELDDAFKKVDL